MCEGGGGGEVKGGDNIFSGLVTLVGVQVNYIRHTTDDVNY